MATGAKELAILLKPFAFLAGKTGRAASAIGLAAIGGSPLVRVAEAVGVFPKGTTANARAAALAEGQRFIGQTPSEGGTTDETFTNEQEVQTRLIDKIAKNTTPNLVMELTNR